MEKNKVTAFKMLAVLTAHVRKTKSPGEAMQFYVDYVQPIRQYFGEDFEIVRSSPTDENKPE